MEFEELNDIPEIVVRGLRIESPCAKCAFHRLKAAKNKVKTCMTCEARLEYDYITSTGYSSVPFIPKPAMRKLGMMEA